MGKSGGRSYKSVEVCEPLHHTKQSLARFKGIEIHRKILSFSKNCQHKNDGSSDIKKVKVKINFSKKKAYLFCLAVKVGVCQLDQKTVTVFFFL